MCTLSLIRDADSRWRVTMNRDEARSRGPERFPTEIAPGIFGPSDSDAGGTWFAARADGCWAAVLNGYSPNDVKPLPDRRSRGVLPIRVLAQTWVPTPQTLVRFASFCLLRGAGAWVDEWSWDRKELIHLRHRRHDFGMRNSSSVRAGDTDRYRGAAFAMSARDGHPLGADGLPHFHGYREAGQETLGVLMSRQMSRTHSIIQLILKPPASPEIRYWPVTGGHIGSCRQMRIS